MSIEAPRADSDRLAAELNEKPQITGYKLEDGSSKMEVSFLPGHPQAATLRTVIEALEDNWLITEVIWDRNSGPQVRQMGEVYVARFAGCSCIGSSEQHALDGLRDALFPPRP